jgi:hypothetical protein
MDLLATTVSQKQRIFTDELSLTKAVEMPSADMKTSICPRGFFFFPFALQNECCWEKQSKTKQSKAKKKKKKQQNSTFL